MNGIIFDIIDFLSQHLIAMGLRGIPFYAVSPIAEESLKYSNICGEWYVKIDNCKSSNFFFLLRNHHYLFH